MLLMNFFWKILFCCYSLCKKRSYSKVGFSFKDFYLYYVLFFFFIVCFFSSKKLFSCSCSLLFFYLDPSLIVSFMLACTSGIALIPFVLQCWFYILGTYFVNEAHCFCWRAKFTTIHIVINRSLKNSRFCFFNVKAWYQISDSTVNSFIFPSALLLRLHSESYFLLPECVKLFGFKFWSKLVGCHFKEFFL